MDVCVERDKCLFIPSSLPLFFFLYGSASCFLVKKKTGREEEEEAGLYRVEMEAVALTFTIKEAGSGC